MLARGSMPLPPMPQKKMGESIIGAAYWRPKWLAAARVARPRDCARRSAPSDRPSRPTRLAIMSVDAAAWVAAALAARWQYRRWPDEAVGLSKITGPSYFIALGLGRARRARGWSDRRIRCVAPIACAVAQHRRRAGRRHRGGRAVEARPRRPAVDRRSAGPADLRRHHRRPPRLLLRRACPIIPTASRRACRGRSISATESAGIRSSSMNRCRWPPSSQSICARASTTPPGPATMLSTR